MLTKDSKFKDSTWPATVEDPFVRQHAEEGRWILKEKAEADHCAGSVGREAVQLKSRSLDTQTLRCTRKL